MEKATVSRRFRTRGISTQIAIMTCWIIGSFIITQGFQLYAPALAELRDIPYSRLLTYNTVGSILSLAVNYFGGSFVQRYGGKRILVSAAILAGINFMAIPWYPVAFVGVGVALNGLFNFMLVGVAAHTIIGNWYPRGYSHVMGNVSASIIVCSTVMQPTLNGLTQSSGLSTAMLIFGIAMTALGIAYVFWIKDTPQELGLDPDGTPMTEEEQEKMVMVKGEKSPWTVRKVLTNKSILMTGISWGLIFMGVSCVMMPAMPLMMSKGLTANQSVTILALSGVANLVGSVASGYIAEKIGVKWTSVAYICATILGIAVMLLATNGQIFLVSAGYLVIGLPVGALNNLGPDSYMKLAGARYFASVFRATPHRNRERKIW